MDFFLSCDTATDLHKSWNDDQESYLYLKGAETPIVPNPYKFSLNNTKTQMQFM